MCPLRKDVHDPYASNYNNAELIHFSKNGESYISFLKSYDSIVASAKHNVKEHTDVYKVYRGLYGISNTSMKHVNSFLKSYNLSDNEIKKIKDMGGLEKGTDTERFFRCSNNEFDADEEYQSKSKDEDLEK